LIETLAQVLLNTVKSFPKDDLMLFKKDGAYVPLSTKDFGDRVKFFSLGLRRLGLGPGDRMAILSETGPSGSWRISRPSAAAP
jgi:long-chain acyl-CoA synthetase